MTGPLNIYSIQYKELLSDPGLIIALSCPSLSQSDRALVEFCSKYKNGCVKVVTWICQSYSVYFSPFAKQNQAEAGNINNFLKSSWGKDSKPKITDRQ